MRYFPSRSMQSSSSSPPTGDGAPSWQSAVDAVKQWASTIPFATRAVALLCTFCTLFCRHGPSCFGVSLLYASSKASYFDIVWAFFVSPFVHQGVLHWVLNMLTWVSVAAPIEPAIGSSCLIGLVGLFAVVNNLLFLLIEYIVAVELQWTMVSCVIGLSGVLFALMTFDAWGGYRSVSSTHAPGIATGSHPDSTTLLCGIVPVKTRYAPFAMLFLMLLLFPGSSFIMHLAGIVAGLVAATATQTRQFLHLVGDYGRDSFCSRSRYFEDAPVDVGGRGGTPSAGATSSGFPSLPFVGPPKGFEAFQGNGRRLGGNGGQHLPSAATATNAATAAPPGADIV